MPRSVGFNYFSDTNQYPFRLPCQPEPVADAQLSTELSAMPLSAIRYPPDQGCPAAILSHRANFAKPAAMAGFQS